jgi:hypothetical protein
VPDADDVPVADLNGVFESLDLRMFTLHLKSIKNAVLKCH